MSAGQIGGGVVGGILGYLIPGVGPFLGAQVGMALGGMLDPPKGPTIEGPRLNDLTVQTSTYGATIPRVYGTVALNGNVIWLENNGIKETVRKKKSGGKGGGSKSTTRTYTYSATFAIGLCKGPILGVRRIWIGKTLFYDAGSSDPDTIAASNAAAVGFRIYRGTDTQLPDARIQATLGVANTPAWRGLAYLVFDDLPLAAYGNSLMGAQVKAELFTSGGYTATHALGNYPNLDGYDQPILAFASWGGISVGTYNGNNANSAYGYTVDGLTWEKRNFPWGMQPSAIGGAGDRIMIVGIVIGGPSVAYVITSTDGTNWTRVSLGSDWTGGYQAVTFNGSVWCLSCYDHVRISSDNGASWSAPIALPVVSWYWYWSSCISHNGRLILFNDGTLGNEYLTSDNNGANWTKRTFGFPGGYGCSSMASNGTRILGLVGTSNTCSISTDGGLTWGTPNTIVPGKTSCQKILFGAGVFAAFQFNESTYEANYAISQDGIAWTYYDVAVTTLMRKAVAFTGAKFVSIPLNIANAEDKSYVVTPQLVGMPISLGGIVSAECLQSGILAAGDINVTSLTSAVRGYAVGSVGAIRAALEPLQAAWPFDALQSGYVIKFVSRGGASVATIAAGDLDARGEGQAAGVSITQSREMDSQLPKRVTIRHIDWDREYEVGSQYVERLNAQTVNAPVLDLPIVLTAAEAVGMAEVLLYLYWLERYDLEFSLPWTYAALQPSDVVTLPLPDGAQPVRLTVCDYTSAGHLKCRGKYARSAVYTPAAVPSSPAVSGVTTIVPPRASVYVLLDVPLIDSAQDAPAFLAAMCGSGGGWPGGELYQSTDGGSNWTSLDDFGMPGSTLGIASNTIGVVDSRTVDAASVLNVTLTQGALYSITQLALLNGGNLCAYGSDGRWEIIGVQTVTAGTGNTYALRDLLRGRYGTEWAMGLHQVGDSLVLLDRNETTKISISSASIGASWLYRAVTFGRDISTDSNRSFVYQAVNLKPLSPVFLTGDIDPSTGSWSLAWLRRTRVGGEWRDNVDAMLGETSEAYQVDIFADGTYTNVKRTLTATAPACTYASADQVTDFGVNQTTLYLKVYQISATVGRGYPLTQSLTR